MSVITKVPRELFNNWTSPSTMGIVKTKCNVWQGNVGCKDFAFNLTGNFLSEAIEYLFFPNSALYLKINPFFN